MEVLAQPVAQRNELTSPDVLLDVRDLDCDPLPQLAGDDVAQRVRREVPEHAIRPVDVLQHAVRVIGNLDAQVVAHSGIPGLRQVAQLDPVREDLQLELEPKDDVEVVGHLIGLHSNQRGLDLVRGAIDRLHVDIAEPLGKEIPELGHDLIQIGAAPAHPVLPQATLGLVEAERRGTGERRAPQSPGNAILVHRVSRLVEHGPHGRPLERRARVLLGDLAFVHTVAELVQARQDTAQVVAIEARGQADVCVGDGGRERVDGRIQSPCALLQRQAGHEFLREVLLGGQAILPVQARVVHRDAAVGDGCDQRLDAVPKVAEDGGDLRGRHPRLEVIQERVVLVLEPLESLEAVRVAAPQLDVSLEVRQERAKVRVGARVLPGMLGERRDARHLGPEVGGHSPRLLPAATSDPHETDVVGVVRCRVELG